MELEDKQMAGNSSNSKSSVVTQTNDQCSRSDLYPCEECSKNGTTKCFSTQKKLSIHLSQCHGPRNLTCEICLKSFQEKYMLTRHKKQVHSTANKIICSICGKTFRASASLKDHMFTVHKRKAENHNYFKCDLCSEEFPRKSRLDAHVIKTHEMEKEFQCSMCSKKFIDIKMLNRHKKIAHPSPTTFFTCDVCSMNFAVKEYFLKHRKRSHPNHTHCLRCERSFINKLEFDQHAETNPENTEAFKCQICLATCTSQCNFDWHTDSHIQKLKSKINQSEK